MGDLVQIGDFNFRFTCQTGCTACCRQPGEVWVTAEDIPRIAAYLDLDDATFRERYCLEEEGRWRLQIPVRHDCLFLTETGCRIHAVKPLQCQSFPFWPENVGARRTWKNLRNYCPGVGVGEILDRDDVRHWAQRCKDELDS